MAIITTGAHPKALWPGVHAFAMGLYNQHATEYDKVFTVESSSMAYEEDVEVSAFDLAQIKSEGAAVAYTGHSQGWTKRYTHVAYALGYIVTKEEIADNLYKSRAFKRAQMLTRSFKTTKEMVHFNILNRAFDPNYVGGDGKELIATDHPSAAGNWSNELGTPADLSEASLEDMLTMIMQAKNSKGHPIQLQARKLVVAPSNAFNAERILKSSLQNDTGNNAVNAIRSMGLLPEGAMVGHYLTDDDAWFILTDAPNGLMSFQRAAYEFTQDNDFDTENAKAKGYERYSAGWTDPRAIYGSAGA